MISSPQSAYEKIANVLTANATVSGWTSLVASCPIFSQGCGGIETTQRSGGETVEDLPVGFGVFDIQEAALFLRDHLLQTTGHRIYGLTFTLFPDMKCRIAYDYNPPEGFDETDDTLTLEDAVDRLQKLGVEVDVSDKKS